MTMSWSTRTFHDLYRDALVNILSFCRPLDIVKASMACKSLHSASEVRTLWLTVTRSIMAEHGISPWTYSLETLDNSALKHIATSPARFCRLLKHSPSPQGEIFPLSVRAVVGASKGNVAPGIKKVIKPEHAFLLPGGRFAVIMIEAELYSNEQKACLQFWDLSIPGLGTPFTMIATETFEINYNSWDVVLDEMSATYYFIIQDDRNLEVHKLDFSSTPTFTKGVNKLVVDCEISDWATCGQLVAIVGDSGRVVVWDSERRLATCWDIALPPDQDRSSLQIHIQERDLMIMRNGYLYQWRVPEFQSQEMLCSAGMRDPVSVLPVPLHEPTRANNLAFISTPWSSLPPSFTDLAIVDSALNVGVYRMLPVSECAAKQSDAPTAIPFRRGIHRLSMIEGELTHQGQLSRLRTCNDNLTFCYFDDELEYPVVVRIAPDPSGKSISVTETGLLLGINIAYYRCTLCVASGRMVVVTDARDVFVLDYLDRL